MSLKSALAKLRRDVGTVSPKGLTGLEQIHALAACLRGTRRSAEDLLVLEHAACRIRRVRALSLDERQALASDSGAFMQELVDSMSRQGSNR